MKSTNSLAERLAVLCTDVENIVVVVDLVNICGILVANIVVEIVVERETTIDVIDYAKPYFLSKERQKG